MKKEILYIALALLISMHLEAQTCFPEGITFSSQEEIDQFPELYPNCTEIEGIVSINGNDIINLDSLYNIQSIESSLHIYSCQSLMSIDGLSELQFVDEIIIDNNEALIEVSGFNEMTSLNNIMILNNSNLLKISGFNNLINISNDLKIRNCTNLNEFDAFEQLQSIDREFEFIFISSLLYCPSFQALSRIGDDFYFSQNSEISNLMGFNSLIHIGGNAVINNNRSLLSITGLQNVSSIGQDLDIKYNNTLLDLNGLGKLGQIGGDFSLWYNDSLNSLEGLNRLDSIYGKLLFYGNPQLSSLEPLITLQYIGLDLHIYDNDGLQTLMGLNNIFSLHGNTLYIDDNLMLNSLQGINNIDYLTFGTVWIVDNENLFYCEIENICSWIYDYNDLSLISGNAYGCNDVIEIRRACNAIGSNIHSFPILVDHPKWNVLECDQAIPLHCNTQSYEYIGFKEMCWLNYSIMRIGEDTIYIRADGNKTYFRTTDVCWHEEYLLYDFDLLVGNTAVVGWNHYTSAASTLPKKKNIKVKEKNEFIFNNRLRTYIDIEYLDNDTKNTKVMRWVEGIGSLTHPFYPLVNLSEESEHHYEVLCLDSLWTQLYQNPDWEVCDTLIDAIYNIDDQSNLIISPNPFQTEIRIESTTSRINQINVYTMFGQMIPCQLTEENYVYKIGFDQSIRDGIYLLEIFTAKGVKIKKVIKQ